MTQNLRGPDGAEKPKLSAEERKKRRLKKIRAKARTALNLWLIGDSGPTHAARFTATLPGVAGRGDACKMKIPDPDVSDKHAFFAKHDSGNWWVYDLGSRNGVIVNDTKVVARRLDAGDTVKLGGKSYKVELLKDAANWVIDEPRNRFELVKRIHSGTMGDLFLARWGGFDGRPVAVRVFPPEFDGNPEDIARFIRGSEKGGELKHKSLVRLFRGGRTVARWRGRQAWWLAMEYLSGGSLRDKLAVTGDPMPVETVVRFAADCCDALHELASRGLVHRNINPSCILFGDDGGAKLGDFFLLRDEVIDTINSITQTNIPLAEYAYQPPEQLGAEEGITPMADLYSLAACMYQALTLKSPFNGDQPLPQLISAIRTAKVPRIREINPAVPANLEELILRTMSRNPIDRPAGPRELKAMLAKL